MSDPLSVISAVVGIAVPALHATRQLLDDIRGIIDAPKAIKRLQTDLRSTTEAYDALRAIPAIEWDNLGEDITGLARNTIKTCEISCASLHGDVQQWTKHSKGSGLSKRDRINLGFFKERRLKDMSTQLQATKSTFCYVVSLTTLYSTFRTNRATNEMKDAIEALTKELRIATDDTDDKLGDVEDRSLGLQVMEISKQDDLEDKMAALRPNQQTAAMLKQAQILFDKLSLKANEQSIQQTANYSQQSINITQGAHNHGLQLGLNNGVMNFNGFGVERS